MHPLARIRQNLCVIRERYGVARIGISGSVGDARRRYRHPGEVPGRGPSTRSLMASYAPRCTCPLWFARIDRSILSVAEGLRLFEVLNDVVVPEGRRSRAGVAAVPVVGIGAQKSTEVRPGMWDNLMR